MGNLISNQSNSHLQIVEKLQKVGEGTYGQVWTVKICDGRILAGKFFFKKIENIEAVEREMQAELNLKELSHPNVLHFEDLIAHEGIPVLLTEFISGKTLRDLSRNRALDESTMKNYIRQICIGLQYIHSRGVIHRDLKGTNIMVTDGGTVKLIDFGLSVKLQMVSEQQSLHDLVYGSKTLQGTRYFLAPELQARRRKPMYSGASDVWALGCTVYQIVTDDVPDELYKEFKANAERDIRAAAAAKMSHDTREKLCDFVSRCLATQPEDRPSAAQLLQHPFLQ